MASDAFIVGESWISEHYFTTEGKQSFHQRVLERRKQWDALNDSPRARVGALVGQLSKALASLDEVGDDEQHSEITRPLLDALGYTDPLYHRTVSGPVTWLTVGGVATSAVAVVEAKSSETVEDVLAKDGDTLLMPYEPEEDKPVTSLARLLSTILVADDAPEFVIVFAGRWALLVDRERWPEGRYLAVDVQLASERNETKKGGELDRLTAILAAESVFADAEGTVWWQKVRDESVKHTVGVSQDLREGVRLSIETIANDVVQRRIELGQDPIRQDHAQDLAKQSLRFIYRILFLLYAEASPELKVLPVGAAEFEEGYSLDRMRELVLVELTGDAVDRTHLYDSLAVLFRLIDTGSPVRDEPGLTDGLTFNSLRADLFKPEAIALIAESKLSDGALQRVLDRLLLSKAQKGKDRGFISYADLGINQLGAVYEGLMSYTGFFATEDLHEVAPDGNAEKGSWVVPVDRSGHLDEKHFVKAEDPLTGEQTSVVHRKGSFVYRLSGRDRQQSASYYTPEVLTRFTVSQALEELLSPETSADDILKLTVCEPALGSGAFAIEAVRQLADHYLDRKEAELGVRVDPDERPRELQKVKASIALHQVYGVDLNATAVELAEISLWLDTMSEGLTAPWFGLHLRRGNSLIGARRATFSREQVNSKGWLKDIPTDRPLGESTNGGIHHFLLPADSWGSTAEAKEAKSLAGDEQKALNTWRHALRAKPSKKQVDALANLAIRVETLWELAQRRLEIAEAEARRPISLWGRPESARDDLPHSVGREEIESKLGDPDSAYQRLRRVMDAWCALWFWPLTGTLTDGAQPPTLDQWISGLQAILGIHVEGKGRTRGGESLSLPSGWDELNTTEEIELGFASAQPLEDVLASTPWLRAAERIARQYGFFHWELDFAPIFAKGGFDLQVGNPPWVRPRSDVDALLAEGDPWWQLKAKSTADEDKRHRVDALAVEGVAELVVDGTAEVAATAAFVGNPQQYPYLAGLQPDLYRCFMSQTWTHARPGGSVGLIHPESHFTDEKAGRLRKGTYGRLRRHWQFVNELSLFEVHHLVSYGVHVYGGDRSPSFIQATSLYHPSTVEGSLKHDGSGSEPGLKDGEGRWDLRPHASRIQRVDDATLSTWHEVLEDAAVPVAHTRMVYTVNRASAAVLAKLAAAPRIGSLGLQFSAGWHEKNDRTKGYFDSEWGVPESWDSVILQGPHLHVGTPFYKSPNPTMLHNQDWTAVDLEALPPDAIPATQYKANGDVATYAGAFGTWKSANGPTPIRKHFRIAYRAMAANTGERTLIPALIPPGAAHVNGLFSFGLPDGRTEDLLLGLGSASSLIADFSVRATPKSGIYQGVFERLPLARHDLYGPLIVERVLQLNALSSKYASMWAAVVGRAWSPASPLRLARDRRRAALEIDALVALSLGITIDELLTLYRTQFPVLYKYDHDDYLYDVNGRIVPTSIRQTWRRLGEPTDAARFPESERTAVHPGSGLAYRYDLPFTTLDREADLRRAYDEFAGPAVSRASELIARV
ncbi:class I SAM-dependent DNA methyltransferase [Leifsonia sp. NPDC058194]|uniref:class I SAM-dependent DNA methyltransferase n=1 Tax=Leifsonia sp. NPDC058194 TaxID=3346374 RepID=UPI0036D7600D